MSLMNNTGVIWLDGEFVPWQEAKTHVLTHTLHYGVGVFEGVRAYDTVQGSAIFRLNAHTKRLFNSAKMLKMEIPFSPQELNSAQAEVLKRNNLRAAYIRPMVFYGSEYLGLNTTALSTHVMIAAWEWVSYHGKDLSALGIRICTSSYSRHAVNSALCKAKANGNYINSVLALQDAIVAGYDETLLLDKEGYVAEGSAENIFMFKDGILYTPELTAILDGITRDSIMQLAHNAGLPVQEKRITRDEVYVCDELFFTGTAVEVTPIREIDGRTIADGKPGPITTRLAQMYQDVVCGKNNQYREWLTYV